MLQAHEPHVRVATLTVVDAEGATAIGTGSATAAGAATAGAGAAAAGAGRTVAATACHMQPHATCNHTPHTSRDKRIRLIDRRQT